MVESVTSIRVRYGETDQMGYAYYGVYAQYYEVGRVEAMRRIGLSYREVEDRGIWMPVVDFSIQYKKPARYDDEVTVITRIETMPTGMRIPFTYECRNAGGELLNTGSVTLVCLEKSTGRMCRIPDWFTTALAPFFREK
jgi:acyl-CoA thioester hydrolase